MTSLNGAKHQAAGEAPLNRKTETASRRLWQNFVFRPVVLGIMIGCLALAVSDLTIFYVPTWNSVFSFTACVLAALEAAYSYHVIQTWLPYSTTPLVFRVVEFALFFILLKAARYMGVPWNTVLADIRQWPLEPIALFDLQTIITFIFTLLAWNFAHQSMRDFERLDEPPDAFAASPFESLTGRILQGGVVIFITAGLAYMMKAPQPGLDRPPLSDIVVTVLVYFMLGLLLLGQARYIHLRKEWINQKIAMDGELSNRWIRYGLAFIALAALVALILPTGYTVGLLALAGRGLGFIIQGLGNLMFLFVALVLWILQWIFSLLNLPTAPPPAMPQPPAAPPENNNAPTLAFLWSLLFWVMVAGMVIYVVRSYLNDHPEVVQILRRIKLFRILHDQWLSFRQWFRGVTRQAVDRMPSMPRLIQRAAGGGVLGLFRQSVLSPRERIFYYYLSTLQHADRKGIPRRPPQTPYEYETTLAANLPQTQADAHALTETFVEARYSRKDIGPELVKRMQAEAQQVKKALQALRKKPGKQPQA